MEETYNNTLSSLLYAPGARNWYEDLNITVKPLPKKQKPNFPVIPNKFPILPSGEIANLTPPPDVAIQMNGTQMEEQNNQEEPTADDFELSDDEEMEYEETMICNTEPSVQPIIHLDSCGREVENFREIMQPEMSPGEDKTDEQKFAFENASSAHSEPPAQEAVDSSDEEFTLLDGRIKLPFSIMNKSRTSCLEYWATANNKTGSQNEQVENAFSIISKQQTKDDKIDRQNIPVKNNSAIYSKGQALKKCLISDDEAEHQNAQVKNTAFVRRKRLTSRKRQSYVKKDNQNGLVKYTYFKIPIERPEISTDDNEILSQNGTTKNSYLVRNRLCETSSSDDEQSHSCHDEEGCQENVPINDMNEEYPSISEVSPDPISSDDEEDSVMYHKSMMLKEKDNCFVIYINVGDFQAGEVAVYVDDDVLKVVGNKGGDSPNSFLLSSKFHWQYKIPDKVDIDLVDRFTIYPGVVKIVCPKKLTATTIDDLFY